MKLECKIGSINLVGEKATIKQGEIFELSNEAKSKALIDHGYAVEVPLPSKTAKAAKPAKTEADAAPSAEVPEK